MMGFFVFIVVILIAGIIYLEAVSQNKKKPREKFLAELLNLLEGRVEPIPEYRDSFRITFNLDGKEFLFEDIQDEGFKGAINKGFLKIKTNYSRFNLSFTEKKIATVMRSEIIMTSQIPDEPVKAPVKLKVPNEFKDLEIITNDIELVNKLFQNLKLTLFFHECKNIDPRGYPFMSFKIMDGVLILEFQSVGSAMPSLNILYKDVNSIEGYIKSMGTIADAISQFR